MTPPEKPQNPGATQDWAGTRRLLRALRDTMKGGGSVQQRLDRVVGLIAANMVAEVCSIYVLRAGEVLELFASEGLLPEAVHRTRLRVGEGLVGRIALKAESLALPDAQAHPDFAYRPETGEEIYHSLMGVPIEAGSQALGVLVIQNRTRRSYTEEEVEALETVAMVLGELLLSAEVVASAEGRSLESRRLMPARIPGLVLSEGLAIGQAVLHHWGIVIEQTVAEDVEAEEARLADAVAAMREAVDDLVDEAGLDGKGGGEILETYRMFAHDTGWLDRMRGAVRGGLTAEAAVERVQKETRQRMARVKDPYLRERLADLEDLAYRLLQALTGVESSAESLPEDAVLIARNLGPVELLDYDTERLRAIVLEEGSNTAHVAIVARALGIPAIGRAGQAMSRAMAGDTVIVDAENGQLFLRPGEGVLQSFAQNLADRERRMAEFAATRDLPAVTRDGVSLQLQMNAGLLIDVSQLEASGAEGIGLFRTEIPFMVRESFPSLAQQTELYQRILDQAEGRPVTFRTLDIGGDKAPPYWPSGEEENPAMGWRALRIGLDRPAVLREQLRAMVRAAGGRRLRVMFPMVATVEEFERAKAILERELVRAEAAERPLPSVVQAGVMLEVPALLWQLDDLLARVDFVSVGSNDLFQFLYAADRGNALTARRYDLLSPPMLRLFRDLTRRANAAGVPLTVCGEAAGHSIEAMALAGCGVRSFSMAPGRIAAVKTMLRSLDLGALEEMIAELPLGAASSVRGRLRGFARDHGVAL